MHHSRTELECSGEGPGLSGGGSKSSILSTNKKILDCKDEVCNNLKQHVEEGILVSLENRGLELNKEAEHSLFAPDRACGGRCFVLETDISAHLVR